MQPTTATHPAGIHGVISVLADLADAATGDRPPSRGRPPEHFRWLDVQHVESMAAVLTTPPPIPIGDRQAARDLAAVDAIRPGEHSLRLGWLWVAGTATDDTGTSSSVFTPLVTTEAVVSGGSASARGELQLTPLVEDRAEHQRLEEAVAPTGVALGGGAFHAIRDTRAPSELLKRVPRLHAWAQQAAAAAGLPASDLVPAHSTPSWFAGRDGLRIVVGLALYATDTTPDFSPAGSLRLWHERVGTTWTALHALYLDRASPPVPAGQDLPSAFRLTDAQHTCVVRSRTDPVTVVAGAPGTGKTHTIAAIVGDAVAHGRTVLVAAKSSATVQAITELIASRPGPDPAVFDAHSASALSRRLAAGEPAAVPAEEVDRRADAVRRSLQARDERWTTLAGSLTGLGLMGDLTRVRELRDRLPGLFGSGVSLHEVEVLAAETGLTRPAWYRLGDRRRWSRLCDLLGTRVAADPTDLRDGLALARAFRVVPARVDEGTGGPGAGFDWRGLADAQESLERSTGSWMDGLARDERRLTRKVRGARAALATALRAGRAVRRAKLAELGADVTTALPVWVGTLGDVDDLLPMRPALFDLVVLDEASSIDQPRGATALLRGSRAVIVGDPQQLRHVSFVPTDAIDAALVRHLPDAPPALAARLDVRGNSVFDVGASAAPVRHLDEHFRSGAHLFDFVGERLYGGRVRLATSTPVTESDDLIDVVRLDAERTAQKVVVEEVDWVVERLGQLLAEGARSVGVVSPFRAQADAIEEAARHALAFSGISQLGLRVGTVHAFQGMERDVVIVSLGIGAGDGPRTWRFADDPHLFAVMATRARRRAEWVLSASPPAGSLIGAYLAQADQPPATRLGVHADDRWTRALADALVDAGAQVSAPYRVGRHTIDLVVHDDRTAMAVETRIHPDGPHAHIRRHLELLRAGWPVRLAPEAVWGDRLGELAIHLRQALAAAG